ncbi:MAG TPA: DUF4373 domain-containing protein [Candidatus Blautia faecipullorum]|nr:DUF4373 domain-containing protein [Candidatus Blautia faecipullorum]
MNKKEKKTAIEKREKLDNSVLAEINQKYPKVSVNGVAYDLGLTYFTIETDYLSSVNVRKLIKAQGAEVIAVICFFRQEMCQPYGWYCKVDKDNLENLIERCAFTLKMNEEEVQNHYQALIDNQIFFLLNDEKGSYLADTQQLFNFEILNNSRIVDRERKAKARKKAKEQEQEQEQEEIEDTTPETPVKAPLEEIPKISADEFLLFNEDENEIFF